MKNFIFIIAMISILGCEGAPSNPSASKKITETEQDSEDPATQDPQEPEIITTQEPEEPAELAEPEEISVDKPLVIVETEPKLTEEPEEVPELANITSIAELYYNNNVVSLKSDLTLGSITETSNYLRRGNYTLNGRDFYNKKTFVATAMSDVANFYVYDKVIFYTDARGSLSKIEKGNEELITAQFATYKWNFTALGMYSMLKRVLQDGTVSQIDGVSFIGYDYVVESVAQPTGAYKIYYDGEEVGATTQPMHLYKAHSYKLNDKIYFARGPVLDLDSMSVNAPVYGGLGVGWVGGSIFTSILNGGMRQPKYYFIGDDGADIIYCVNSYTGKLYKYDTVANTLNEWIKLLDGCDSDDYGVVDTWFSTAVFAQVGDLILYFDGQYIKRFNLLTQENVVIAEATNFKGWAL